MAQALGARLLCEDGADLGRGGGELLWLHRIDLSGLDPRLKRVRIDAAVNWHNALLGPRGVARVFGPQKGRNPGAGSGSGPRADPLGRRDPRRNRGGRGLGTGGRGLGRVGGGADGLCGRPAASAVRHRDAVPGLRPPAGRGRSGDYRRGFAGRAKPLWQGPLRGGPPGRRAGVPTIALAGTIGKGAGETLAHGISAFASIVKRPCTLEEAMAKGEKLLRRAAEDAIAHGAGGPAAAERPAPRGLTAPVRPGSADGGRRDPKGERADPQGSARSSFFRE